MQHLFHHFWQNTGRLFQEILKSKWNVFKKLFNIFIKFKVLKVVLIFCFGILGIVSFLYCTVSFLYFPVGFLYLAVSFLYFAVVFFILSCFSLFCRGFFILPLFFFMLQWFSLFCCDFLYFSVIFFTWVFFILPWIFFLLPWYSLFCSNFSLFCRNSVHVATTLIILS